MTYSRYISILLSFVQHQHQQLTGLYKISISLSHKIMWHVMRTLCGRLANAKRTPYDRPSKPIRFPFYPLTDSRDDNGRRVLLHDDNGGGGDTFNNLSHIFRFTGFSSFNVSLGCATSTLHSISQCSTWLWINTLQSNEMTMISFVQ